MTCRGDMQDLLVIIYIIEIHRVLDRLGLPPGSDVWRLKGGFRTLVRVSPVDRVVDFYSLTSCILGWWGIEGS